MRLPCGYHAATITNNEILDNAAGYGGGGIQVYGISTVTVSDNFISGNKATEVGGGIWLEGVETANVVNKCFLATAPEKEGAYSVGRRTKRSLITP